MFAGISNFYGNVANSFVLVSSVSFLAAVVLQHNGVVSVFDESFMADGFCVMGERESPLNSHALCFYGDTVAAALLAALAWRHRRMKGFQPVENAALATFMHGLGHLTLFNTRREDEDWNAPDKMAPPGQSPDKDLPTKLLEMAPMWLFFCALLRSAPAVPSAHAAVHSVPLAALLYYVVPRQISFTYVNSALLCVSILYAIAQREKDDFYTLVALLINLPVSLCAWLEGTACESGYRAVGGHILYDSCIYLSFFAYYAAALSSQAPPPAAPAAKKAL